MPQYRTQEIHIYFGQKDDDIDPHVYTLFIKKEQSYLYPPFYRCMQNLGIYELIFLRQVHTNRGLCIKQRNKTIEPFQEEGDYIITDLPHIGIGVLVADCLPIVLFDVHQKVIGVVHAGWRGTAADVVVHAIKAMQRYYGVQVKHLKVFFGPCARICCYQVQEDVRYAFPCDMHDNLFQQKDDMLFFDLVQANIIQMIRQGVEASMIDKTYNQCTICDDSFFSYRRQGAQSGRQMIVASLIKSRQTSNDTLL